MWNLIVWYSGCKLQFIFRKFLTFISCKIWILCGSHAISFFTTSFTVVMRIWKYVLNMRFSLLICWISHYQDKRKKSITKHTKYSNVFSKIQFGKTSKTLNFSVQIYLAIFFHFDVIQDQNIVSFFNTVWAAMSHCSPTYYIKYIIGVLHIYILIMQFSSLL